ncbi:MAG: diguanylate cyclase [Chloroflexi bacterium]|nr:diguanylate cyclase [Chloroflexota bacterium]
MPSTRHPSTPQIIGFGLLATVLITCASYAGANTSLSYLYLIPIVLVTWRLGWPTGVVLSLICTGAGLASDLLIGVPRASLLAPYASAALRFAQFLLATFVLARLKSSLEREKGLARTDDLTGLANSRMFVELARSEINRARRYKRPMSVAYIDLDNFKAVNDNFGHQTGDLVLRAVADGIRSHIRTVDSSARLGGDEFAILLPETGVDAAAFVLAKLRGELLRLMEQRSWQITFSIGLMTFISPPESVNEMVRLADALMYEVKKSGKNSIRQSQSPGVGIPATLPIGAELPFADLDLAMLARTDRPAANPSHRLFPWRATISATCRQFTLPYALLSLGTAAALLVIVASAHTISESLPGSSFYALKRGGEALQLELASDPAVKARIHIALADQRLMETGALLRQGRSDLASQTAEEYDNEVDAVLEVFRTEPREVSLQLLQQIVERLADQQDALRQLERELPVADQAMVQRNLVRNRSALGQIESVAAAVVLLRVTPTIIPPSNFAGTPTKAPAATSVALGVATATGTPGAGTSALPAFVTSTATTPDSAPTDATTATATSTPNGIPTDTPTQETALPTAQASAIPTAEPLPTATDTPTATQAPAPTGTATLPATPSATPAGVPSTAPTREATATDTPSPTVMPPPTATPISTPNPVPASTRTPIPTSTLPRLATPTTTATPSPTRTSTLWVTASRTMTPTATSTKAATPVRTATPTRTLSPTGTPTRTPAPPTPTRTPHWKTHATKTPAPTRTPRFIATAHWADTLGISY